MSLSRKLARKQARLAAATRTRRSTGRVADASAPGRPSGGGDQEFRVINVSAFWRNNVPGGLGIGLRFEEEPDTGAQFCRVLQRQLDVYDARATPAFIVGQLQEWATRGAELSDEETLVAITNIYWLQERGHIAKDEYNGVIFAYVVEGTRTLMLGEQNPVVVDLKAAADGGIDVTEMASAGPLATSAAVYQTVFDHARNIGSSPRTAGSRR